VFLLLVSYQGGTSAVREYLPGAYKGRAECSKIFVTWHPFLLSRSPAVA
jgi:hypothetical protein